VRTTITDAAAAPRRSPWYRLERAAPLRQNQVRLYGKTKVVEMSRPPCEAGVRRAGQRTA
jgi:hypothetical protein